MSVLCLSLCRRRGFWSPLTRSLQIHSQSSRYLEKSTFQNRFRKNSFCTQTPIRDRKVLSAISHGVPPGYVQGPCRLHFHTSSHNRALPAPLIWMVLKPLQKIAAIILGRSIRKWWVALPDNRRQLLREWAWHRRWQLAAVTGATMVIIVLLLLTHLDDTPVTGRTRLLVFSKENYTELAEVTSEAYMQEFEQLLIPEKDPRHQVVERVVQHLAQRNKDIPGMSDVTWTVHVVQSPEINAFVLPNGKVFMFTGMLEAVADVHQLTIVLGHEMAHALLGHSAEQASLSHILDLLSILFLTAIWAVCPRDSLALLGQWAQGKLTELIFNRPYSRKLEAEADQVGLQLAAKACADVRSGPVFWQQMEIRDQLRGEPTFPEWLSTHPSHRNRVSQLERLIPQALELRESCVCPALPATDPRAIFSKSVRALLETSKAPKGEVGQKVAIMSLHQKPAGLSVAPNNPNMLEVEASKMVNVTVE
ncbi:metalloendopeptidase OMA1, mitochondrial [Neosynchiropus ocellatus]